MTETPTGDAPQLADELDRRVIQDDLDSTLVVEAAAGTGKTTELVRRIVRVIESGRADVTQIACVTFTEKAAGELKLRLRETLERARSSTLDRPSSVGAHQSLTAAINKLEEAQISTIHGFCADLLRERPVEARIDPLFAVLTEAQARRLYDTAFTGWFQEQLTNPSEAVQRSLRRPVFSGWGAAADRDEGPVDRLRHAGWELIQWRDFTTSWQQPPFERSARVDALVGQLSEFAQLAADPESRYDNFHFDTQAARQLAGEIERTEAVVGRDYTRLEASLIDLARNRQFQRARKGSGRLYKTGVLREEVARARDQLQTELTRFEADANADLATLLCEELRACADRYEQEKANAGALDFLDLLLKARNLVKEHAEVRRSFQQRFTRLFVDEFQDTDPLQAEILLLLAADDPAVSNWREVRPIPGKLFLVGDPKQSIYRFRRADVGTYRDVYRMLENRGAKPVTLSTSFRARPDIQRAINAAFAPVMAGDDEALQARYVQLEPFRPDLPSQPAVVVLPVPKPYGAQRVSNVAVEESLPDAVGAYVEWLINKSGWKVADRSAFAPTSPHRFGEAGSLAPLAPTAALGFQPGEREHLVPIQARHICLLFRRFVSYEQDMTRPYVRSLEARGVPHLLVGGRSFHNRAEIETLRAALAAIEWPEDELSVFASLRGSLFAIADEELMEYRERFKRFHPFNNHEECPAGCRPIADALQLLRRLHSSRNHVPVATTISRLLEATRVHVRFALEHGGEQVLANVLHVAELARQYEADGGISFRGFIDELRAQAEDGQAGEAPILEEGSDGVRLMTVHKAKGLEFPVVILADITAKLQPSAASRYLDPASGTCAMRLAGCSPHDLIQHEQDELRRDHAEGIRLTYVAATRARDLLVVPAVGDEARDGWIEPLNGAIYPPIMQRRDAVAAGGCPQFASRDSVLMRPNGDPALPVTVAPGRHQMHGNYSVVWWDPRNLDLGAEPPLGIRRSELIVKDVPKALVDEGLKAYQSWRSARDAAVETAASASIAAQTATAWAAAPPEQPRGTSTAVEMIELPRQEGRPSGVRFGALVHAALATATLDADPAAIRDVVSVHARALSSTDEEITSAVNVVQRVLAHSILDRARRAAEQRLCRREVPVTSRVDSTRLVEGFVDLAFREADAWTIVDFKTDEELRRSGAYEAQLGVYVEAVKAATGMRVNGILMRV